jgi:hypothetical protein
VTTPDASLAAAVASLLARRAGTEVPAGTPDRVGRWHPVDSERADCCRRITSTRSWEAAARRHCVSARHVAALHGVPLAKLEAAAKAAAVSTHVDTAERGVG